MKRTRKWAFVEQEATRLAGLGLAPREIARRLGVAKSTVTRWIASGKLARRDPVPQPTAQQSPGEWAASVRHDYALDATDAQLVTLAQRALELSLDPTVALPVQLHAAGRFQAIVRQLALVTRLGEATTSAPPAPVRPPVPRTDRADPRTLLMVVK